MNGKPAGRKVFFPTNDLNQAADSIQSLLNNTIDESGKKVHIPNYVNRQYLIDVIGTIVDRLIGVQMIEDVKDAMKRRETH